MELDFELSEAPITNKFVSDMTNIIERINTDPEIIKLRQTNYKEFEDYVFNIEEFKPFIEEYFNFFMMLISPVPMPFEVINMFITYKAKVETGRITQKQADEEIAEYMNNKFIYSKYGGKDKFIKEMIKFGSVFSNNFLSKSIIDKNTQPKID